MIDPMSHPPSPRRAPGNDGSGLVIVIPTFNERRTLPVVVERVQAALPAAHLLVVDDSSPDGTGEWAEALAQRDGRIHCLHRPSKSGLATAYVEGMEWALQRGYGFVAQMDADGSHRPEDLPKLVARMGGPDRPDLVIGSRWVRGGRVNGWSRKRILLSKAGNRYVRFCLGTPVRDATAGMRLHRASFLRDSGVLAEVAATGFGFQVEMTLAEGARGARIAEAPITFDERMSGESKLSGAIFVEELVMVTKGGLSRLAGAARRLVGR